MKIGVIIQARMGSTRLPGKVIKKLNDKTVLEHVISRVRQSKTINNIIIATTTNERDTVIALEALRCGVEIFRGSEDDVLSRYYMASKKFGLDIVVRITADCPLIDPKILDNIINFYISNHYDIVSNASSNMSERTYPRGLDTEVFSFKILESAHLNAKKVYQREHVTPYIYENSNNTHYYKNNVDYSKHRWTLDTEEDYKLITHIYNFLYHGKHDFYLEDIIDLFRKYPKLYDINSKIEQKKIK
ncbi:glycosyltransferase family protein [Mycoplasmatota bacterium]|nr:glycosyltransferase family protein [Mycoplasmatota bacterium]